MEPIRKGFRQRQTACGFACSCALQLLGREDMHVSAKPMPECILQRSVVAIQLQRAQLQVTGQVQQPQEWCTGHAQREAFLKAAGRAYLKA